MSTEILVLGASYAGFSWIHHFLRNEQPKLAAKGQKIHITLVDQSNHFWWHVAAPRQLVVKSAKISYEKTFVSIPNCLKAYNQSLITFKQATVKNVDFEKRTVLVSSTTEEFLSYDRLVIATGTSTPTPLTSLQGPHTHSIDALNEMRKRLGSGRVKKVVISGGGPTGVEIAGEIGEALNGTPGCFSGPKSDVQIQLVTAGTSLIPGFGAANAKKAEKLLKRVGVEVIYNAKVERTDQAGDSATIFLSNGQQLQTDVYIPAVGSVPNTSFLPRAVLDERGRVATDKRLRVSGASNVYALGDVTNLSRGGIMYIEEEIPILSNNLAKDLGSPNLLEKEFAKDLGETGMVPIGPSNGVGAFNGHAMPGFIVKFVKGRDYMLWMNKGFFDGSKWGKVVAA